MENKKALSGRCLHRREEDQGQGRSGGWPRNRRGYISDRNNRRRIDFTMYQGIPLLLLVIGAGSAAGQAAELALDPLMSFISCLREVRPGYCLRERALSYFEKWITGDEDEDDQPGNPDHDDDPGERLSPYWKTMVNTVAERIAGFYGEDDEEEEQKKPGQKKEGEERKSTELEGKFKLIQFCNIRTRQVYLPN